MLPESRAREFWVGAAVGSTDNLSRPQPHLVLDARYVVGLEMASLRQIDRSTILIGATLPGHLRDHAGRVLVTRGTTLEPSHIDLITKHARRGIYVGSDWPEPQSESESDHENDGENPAEIIKRLQELRGKRGSRRERQHERHTWNVVLTLELSEESAEGVRHRELQVTTHDICAGGFAFVFRQFIREGTLVRARFDMLSNKPILTGVVRNCFLLGGTQHRIGVQFQQQ